jgi:pimeloyl-ACP methyl ester carboxylesterase
MGDALPPKFFLAGHSRGGYLTGLYASQHPERIEKLFMISPSGLAHIPDDKLDIYSIRTDDSKDPPSKEKVEHSLKAHQEGKSYMEAIKAMPFEAAQSAVAKLYAKSFTDLTS